MARPESERSDAPRCPSCGQFMQPAEPGEKLIVYECCGIEQTVFRPQFDAAPNSFAGTPRRER